ncbi:DinB family protein [Deinococcus sp.]|uniref:DinB family protein n=1 Tax=Deinococcus sp. TaxID=47478 RepID=UPI0025DF39F4|nr:DinB family protein [Deinococcus sp.]
MSSVELNPSSREEIISALQDTASSLVAWFGELSPERYFQAPPSGKWSLDQHLRHVTLVLERVGLGFAELRPAEVQAGPGRTYLQLRDDYRAALSAGGTTPPAFAPAPASQQTAAAQAQALQALQSASVTLVQHLGQPGWTEHALDSVRLPHVLLSQLSAREMLFFTVYHNLHHLEGARNSMEQQ